MVTIPPSPVVIVLRGCKEKVDISECLQEPIEALPEGDWYCDFCRNDASEIVQAGEQVRYCASWTGQMRHQHVAQVGPPAQQRGDQLDCDHCHGVLQAC